MPRGENAVQGRQGFQHTTPTPANAPTPNPNASTGMPFPDPAADESGLTAERLAAVTDALLPDTTTDIPTRVRLVEQYRNVNPSDMNNTDLVAAFRALTEERKVLREQRDAFRETGDQDFTGDRNPEEVYAEFDAVWRPIANERYARRLDGPNGSRYALSILAGNTKVTGTTVMKAHEKIQDQVTAAFQTSTADPADSDTVEGGSVRSVNAQLVIDRAARDNNIPRSIYRYPTISIGPRGTASEVAAIKELVTSWSNETDYPETFRIWLRDQYDDDAPVHLKVNVDTWETVIVTEAGEIAPGDGTLDGIWARAAAICGANREPRLSWRNNVP